MLFINQINRKMKVGKITFLKWTLFLMLSPWIFLVLPNLDSSSRGYLSFALFILLPYIVILFGFSQIFHFKESELVIWYFNPLKKNIHIPYKSITNVEIFRGLSSMVINAFYFKTATGEIIINNNVFSMCELKRIKKYFESKNIECEI